MTPNSGIVGVLSPSDMQRMLGNHQNGTVSPDQIGVMPNLEKIIANEYH